MDIANFIQTIRQRLRHIKVQLKIAKRSIYSKACREYNRSQHYKDPTDSGLKSLRMYASERMVMAVA